MNRTEKEKSWHTLLPQKDHRSSIKQSLQKNLTKLVFSFLIVAFLPILSFAQNTTNVSINTVWPFNTGFTLAPASTPSTVPVGSSDPNWQVSTSISSGPAAIVINPPSQGGSPCNLGWSNLFGVSSPPLGALFLSLLNGRECIRS